MTKKKTDNFIGGGQVKPIMFVTGQIVAPGVGLVNTNYNTLTKICKKHER